MSEVKIRVLGKRVLVKADSQEKMTKSGLYIPDNVKRKPVSGVAINVGSRCTEVDDGDAILFDGTGSPIEIHGEKYIVLLEADVVAVISDGKIRVLGDRVLFKEYSQEKMTKSGLYIPDNFEEMPVMGVAINVGSECTEVDDGDAILFGKGAGSPIEIHGEKYSVMREADVVAIM